MVRPQNASAGAGGFPPDDTSHPLYLHPSDNTKNGYTPSLSEPVGMLTNASQSSYVKTKDKLHCTHYGKNNHIVDKCFQLHDFSLGFGRGHAPVNGSSSFGKGHTSSGFGRGRGRFGENGSSVSRSVHHVASDDTQNGLSNSGMSLSTEQCSHLINFLQQQLNVGYSNASQQNMSSHSAFPSNLSPSISSSGQSSDPSASFSGFFTGEDDWDET